jgi:hypothetical protein
MRWAVRWGSVPLIDMLKEAVLRTGCLNAVTSVVGSSSLKPEVLAERLMLAIFGYGTNTGIRAVASGGHAHSEDDIRYVRRRYLTPQIATDIAIAIANATFTARDVELWGEGTTTVASDSTHVRAYDQNIFTTRSPGEALAGGGLAASSAPVDRGQFCRVPTRDLSRAHHLQSVDY